MVKRRGAGAPGRPVPPVTPSPCHPVTLSSSGGAAMSETRALLGKIAALRQRLEQAQAMAREADSVAASLLAEKARRLQDQVDVGEEVDVRLVDAVRAAAPPAADTKAPLPRQ